MVLVGGEVDCIVPLKADLDRAPKRSVVMHEFLRPDGIRCKSIRTKYLLIAYNCLINGCCAESDPVRVSRP